MEAAGGEKEGNYSDSVKLCSKSKRCSKEIKHRGQCDSKGRDLKSFWEHSSKQKVQKAKRQLKEKSDTLQEEQAELEAKVAKIESSESDLEKKQHKINEEFRQAEIRKEEAAKEADKILEDVLGKRNELEGEVEEKTTKLRELTAQYKKLRVLLEQSQQSKARRINIPTTFETINSFNSSTRYRRRQETQDILEYIHGGHEGSLYGAWDYLSSNMFSDLFDKFIASYKRGKYLQGMFGRTLSTYKNSVEAMRQATALKYHSYLSRRKYNFVCKTQSSYFDPDKELWVPRNMKCLGVDVRMMRQVSDSAVESFVKGLDIGHISQIPNVSGLCRTVTGLVFMLLDLHLRLPHLRRKLSWLNGNTNHFIFQFSDDGAPETSELSMSIGSLTCWNFWDKVRSRDYHYLLHCLSVNEKDQVMSDLWEQITEEMQMLEGNVITVCDEECTLEFQPSADQSWQSWAGNELNQAATHPSPYADVHKVDLSKMGASIGHSESDTWHPPTMEKRLESVGKLRNYMATLSARLSENTKHTKQLQFMADNGMRQLGPPRIGVFADRQRPEPMHVEINAWQHFLNLVYHEAVKRNMVDTFLQVLSAPICGETGQTMQSASEAAPPPVVKAHNEGVAARVASIPIVHQQALDCDDNINKSAQSRCSIVADAPRHVGCGLSFVCKKIREHHNDETKRHNQLPLRLIGHQAILLAQYSYRVLDALSFPDEGPSQKTVRLALGKIAEKLRDAGTLFNKVDTSAPEIELLSELCTMYFNLNSLFFSSNLNVTVWTVGYAIPYHASLLFNKYRCGYGIVSLQGKESKHAGIKHDLSLSNRSTVADISGKWWQVMRANYVRTFYLPEHHPMPSTYTSHYSSRIPPHCLKSDTACHCGRDLGNAEDSMCTSCTDAYDIEQCAKQQYILPSVLEILKPVVCNYCAVRFPDQQECDEHVVKKHNMQLQDVIPHAMTVPQLKAELQRRGLSTTGNKAILIKRLEGNL